MMLPQLEDIMATLPTRLRAHKHHGYKSWSCTWYDEQGHRRTKRFGKVKAISKTKAILRYETWKAREWGAKPHIRNPLDPNAYRVDALAREYHAHALKVYVKRGRRTTHISEVAAAMNALIDHFGETSADALTSPDLTRLRDKMIHSGIRKNRTKTLSVRTVNGRIRIIKQAFKWARSYGKVTAATAYDVSLVEYLRAGRCEATPPENILPVPQDVLDVTRAHCPPTVRDMIDVMILTGMRPGELCAMRRCDLDMTGDVWKYTITEHKTEHHGKTRFAYFGPKAQAIVAPYLERRKLTEPVFTPMDAHRERLEIRGFEKVKAYQTSRSRFKPGRAYTNDTFRNAVQRACDRAFDADGARRAAHDWSYRWHPHQLRHNAGTLIRGEFGLEAAANVLGHAQQHTTLIYAERAEEKAKEVARKVG